MLHMDRLYLEASADMPRNKRGATYRPAQDQYNDGRHIANHVPNNYVPLEPNQQQQVWPAYDSYGQVQPQVFDPNLLSAAYYAGDTSTAYPNRYYQQPTNYAWPHPMQHGNLPGLVQSQQPNSSRYPLRSKTNRHLRSYNTDAYHDVVESIEARDEVAPIPAGNQSSQLSRLQTRWSTSRSSRDSSAPPMKEPIVREEYKTNAMGEPQLQSQAKKLLLVLDLNGTFIVRKRHDPQGGQVRPGALELISYLFDNHVIMVSTSTRLVNAEKMLERLMTSEQRKRLVTIRARETFGLTLEQYNSKVQIYKNLEAIWSDKKVQRSAEQLGTIWSQTNTVLIDDSILKAKAQPYNLIQVDEFMLGGPHPRHPGYQEWERKEMSVMQAIQQKLELLKWQQDVSCQIRRWQLGEIDGLDVINDTSPADVTKVSKIKKKHRKPKSSRKPGETVQSVELSTSAPIDLGYLTPRSISHESETINLDNKYVEAGYQDGETRPLEENFQLSSDAEKPHHHYQQQQQQASPAPESPPLSNLQPSSADSQQVHSENLISLEQLRIVSSTSSIEDLTVIAGSIHQPDQPPQTPLTPRSDNDDDASDDDDGHHGVEI